ncbi:MAG: hypothetical protein A3C55_05390 [Gammaproteobacteria bacterium RIFCSPHIGHO2_02_FULL_42_13]|nr:MAG: hypothetical protein A3C55_05390 [Gammaproteobacteria bacterium RIFCSPHIGHO2_02_FULL_42_13]OGT68501.1 MAG: hypothetical protein A3H43_05880 [Gammaproteobacteria bacterium RIFCSPLOWO2_02_FULL_42_9]
MNNIQALIQKIVATITKTSSVQKIILFGSRARGDAEERSDLDIAIMAPEISDREWLEICDRIEKTDTLLTIDLVRYDTAGNKFQEKIKQEGIVIYERH